ncbi:hypothetical protein G3I50_41300, partial [Streptomyces parvus]|nr:hypothetical protein [Streptomyces parvus]
MTERQFASDTATASRPEVPAPSSAVAVGRSTDNTTSAPVPVDAGGTFATRAPRATTRASS